MFVYGQYQIARISKDKVLSQALVDKYSNWKELDKLNQRLNLFFLKLLKENYFILTIHLISILYDKMSKNIDGTQ